jgi:leader peptidase (prepilin peptidase)/N-methyltransferase
VDVVGLAFPKLYESWFGENPYSVEEIEEEPVVELTMIPFGPYLAAGALVALLANDWLVGLWESYAKSVGL